MEALDADIAAHHLLPLHGRRSRRATAAFSGGPCRPFRAKADDFGAPAVPRHPLLLVLNAERVAGQLNDRDVAAEKTRMDEHTNATRLEDNGTERVDMRRIRKVFFVNTSKYNRGTRVYQSTLFEVKKLRRKVTRTSTRSAVMCSKRTYVVKSIQDSPMNLPCFGTKDWLQVKVERTTLSHGISCFFNSVISVARRVSSTVM